jgi:hypothetical protein
MVSFVCGVKGHRDMWIFLYLYKMSFLGWIYYHKLVSSYNWCSTFLLPVHISSCLRFFSIVNMKPVSCHNIMKGSWDDHRTRRLIRSSYYASCQYSRIQYPAWGKIVISFCPVVNIWNCLGEVPYHRWISTSITPRRSSLQKNFLLFSKHLPPAGRSHKCCCIHTWRTPFFIVEGSV